MNKLKETQIESSDSESSDSSHRTVDEQSKLSPTEVEKLGAIVGDMLVYSALGLFTRGTGWETGVVEVARTGRAPVKIDCSAQRYEFSASAADKQTVLHTLAIQRYMGKGHWAKEGQELAYALLVAVLVTLSLDSVEHALMQHLGTDTPTGRAVMASCSHTTLHGDSSCSVTVVRILVPQMAALGTMDGRMAFCSMVEGKMKTGELRQRDERYMASASYSTQKYIERLCKLASADEKMATGLLGSEAKVTSKQVCTLIPEP